MTSLTIRHSPGLQEHLVHFKVDGSSVESALFSDDGRLTYPQRSEVERDLMEQEPYMLWHEARAVIGFPRSVRAAIRFLSQEATSLFGEEDPTLDLLWRSHSEYYGRHHSFEEDGPSFDRLVAALVMVQQILNGAEVDLKEVFEQASVLLVRELSAHGFPATARSLEELWDGAAPACVGLGLVEI